MELLGNNTASVTDIIVYCGFGIAPSGEFATNITHGGGNMTLCKPTLDAVKKLGLKAHLITKTQNQLLSTVMNAVQNPQSVVDGMLRVCQDWGIDGWNIDWEPRGDQATAEDQAEFAQFLQGASSMLQVSDCELTLDVGHWGLLNNYSLYAGATSKLLDMSLYRGANFSSWSASFQNSLAETGPAKLGVGFGDWAWGDRNRDPTDHWDQTEESVVQRLGAVIASGITEVDVFLLDATKSLPPSFYWSHLKSFLEHQ